MTIKHLGGVFGRNPTFNDVTIEGTLTFEGNIDIDSDITWEDNKKAIFGDDGDLEIYHDGSNSFISESGTGNLQIQAQNLSLEDSAGTRFFLGIQGGETRLYNQGNEKVAVTSTGVDITGNLEIDGGTSTTVFINSSTHNAGVANDATLQFGFGHSGSPDAIGSIKLVENAVNSFDGSMVFSVPSNNGSGGSSTAEALRIASNGNVGIGTTSPTTLLELKDTTATAGLCITANNASTSDINLGDEDDVNIQRIRSDHSDNSLQFTTNNSEAMRIDDSGNVGIGTSSPGSFQAGAENLVIGSGSGDEGMTIYSGTASRGNIYFADGTTGADLYKGHPEIQISGEFFQRLHTEGSLKTEELKLSPTACTYCTLLDEDHPKRSSLVIP